jgi:Ca2+-dependent lipid-binding protein
MSIKKNNIDFLKKKENETSLGTLKFSVLYNSSLQHLTVHLFSASNLPARDSNGLSDPYVKLHLLPSLAKVNE